MFVRFRFEMFPVHALADVRMRLQTMLLQAMTFQRFLDGVEKRHAICQIMQEHLPIPHLQRTQQQQLISNMENDEARVPR